MIRNSTCFYGTVACAIVLSAASVRAASYHVQRLASGFHLPVYATTAPGDDDRIFVVQLGGLASHETDGDPNTSALGKIMIYNRSTGTVNANPFLVIPDTDTTDPVTNEPEVGLWALAFHPDYENNGRYFVNVAVENADTNSPFSEMIRGYSVSANPDVSNPLPDELIMEIPKPSRPGNSAFNHNGSWMGFNPIANAPNDDKQYLYITLGDGGDQHDPDQNGQGLDELFGGTLRIDVDAPTDPGLNYHIPASNPFVGQAGVREEVWNYGLRNPWQASFDRQTGDFWITDVGQNQREEVNFQPASSAGGENFGWRLREGTVATPTGGVGGPAPPGAIDPVYEYFHLGQGEEGFEGNSVAGGRLYRGPIQELQGKYVFADSRSGEVWSFDPANPFGSIERMKQIPAFTPDVGIIDYVVSIGEDNQGNLLIVDYDGELYQVFPNLAFTLSVNRDNGQMTLSNQTGQALDVRGYSLSSASGAIDPAQLTPVTGNYDAPPAGDGSFDSANAWQITSPGGTQQTLTESTTGTAAALGIGESFALSGPGAWIKSFYEDLDLSVTLGDGSVVGATVVYTGNGGSPFDRSDLNFNGTLDPADWNIFRVHFGTNLAGMTLAEAYQFGDLDGDGDDDFYDFRAFQSDYTALNGAGAFAALLNVPEPASLTLGVTVIAVLSFLRRRFCGGAVRTCPHLSSGKQRSFRIATIAAAWLVVGMLSSNACAALVRQYTFNGGTAEDLIGSADGTLNGGATINLGKLELPGTSGSYVSLPGAAINMTSFTDMTFEAWFTFEGGGVWQRVFDFGRTQGGQGMDYVFYSPNSGGGDNRAAIKNDNLAENVATAGPTVSQNTRHHMVVTIDDDANGGTNRMSLYLDGVLGDDVALSYSLSELSNTAAYLGRSTWSGDPYLNGSIDEFRIYSHALSLIEVQNSFAAGPVPLDLLRLDVNTFTGNVSLENTHSESLTFDYYSVASLAGTLDADGWNSLDEQDVDAIGGGSGQSWDLLGPGDEQEVSEGFLLGASTLGPGASLDLGQLFDPSVFGKRSNGDLTFEFALQGSDLVEGVVNYIAPPPLLGDYNDNGVVDAADYTVWRDNLGANIALPNEAVTPNVVNQADYDEWKTRFGDAIGGGSLAAPGSVPEPGAAYLVLATCVGAATAAARRRHRN